MMRSRVLLIAVGLVFLIPVVLAIALHSMDRPWRPSSTVNHGELVRPVRPLDAFTLRTLEGQPVGRDALLDLWTLVYIDTSGCDNICRRNLYKIRQVRLAQGAERSRVQRLFVLTDAGELESLKGALREHPGLNVVTGAPKALERFMAPFELPGQTARRAQRVYLVDPLGNLMMSYPPDADPGGMVEDLERLLKYSRIG